MKKIISLLIVIAVCAGLFSCMPNLKHYVVEYGSSKAQIDEDVKQDEKFDEFLRKINEFSIFVTISISESEGNNDNFAISPASIYMSLAVASECSKDETRQEILDAIGISYDEMKEYTKYYYSLFNKEYTYIDSYGGEHVSAHEKLAASIWIDEELEYNDPCVDSLSRELNCDVYSISFKDGTAKKVINQYIEYKMHNIVKGDVEISRSADFSIISLYHLKEIWNEFGRNLTLSLETYDFTNTDKSVVKEQLIKSTYTGGKVYNSGTYSSFYIETEHGYRVYFMVPNSFYSLRDIFTPYNISRTLKRTEYGFIDEENEVLNYTRLLFPKTSVSFSGDISENLKNDFNITSLFSEKDCNFSGLISSPAYCDAFVHKAEVNLDTKGIEGESIDLAQSSEKENGLPDYKKVYHEFVINRAFGFIITDEDGMILYTGEVNTVK